MKNDLNDRETLEANIYVHSELAKTGEYNRSPHFRKENQQKVRKILERLVGNQSWTGNTKAIDFGCGTGFLIHLMRDLFEEVHGVDITPEMMKQVDLSSGNVFLHQVRAEQTPFPDQTFHFATAYSFLDHLCDLTVFLEEVYRVLKPGGVFYSDLNPNREFIRGVERVAGLSEQTDVPAIVKREITGALHNGEYYEKTFGLNAALLEKAEPLKSISKGFCVEELKAIGSEIGFSKCVVEYDWFLGQAKVMHEQPKEDVRVVEAYLSSVLPVSASLFKYLRIVFTK